MSRRVYLAVFVLLGLVVVQHQNVSGQTPTELKDFHANLQKLTKQLEGWQAKADEEKKAGDLQNALLGNVVTELSAIKKAIIAQTEAIQGLRPRLTTKSPADEILAFIVRLNEGGGPKLLVTKPMSANDLQLIAEQLSIQAIPEAAKATMTVSVADPEAAKKLLNVINDKTNSTGVTARAMPTEIVLEGPPGAVVAIVLFIASKNDKKK